MPIKKNKEGLTPKQAVFVKEYCVDKNATQAAIRAGYSKKTAYSIGQEILNKPEVWKAVQRELNRMAEGIEITQERVLAEFMKHAFYDLDAATDKNGKIVYSRLSKEAKAALIGVTTDRNGDPVFKFVDKAKAMEALARFLGMSEETLNLKGEVVTKVVREFVDPDDDDTDDPDC